MEKLAAWRPQHMEKLVVTPKLSTRPTDFEAAKALEAAGIHPLLSRLWAARGVRNASETQLIWAAMIPPGQLTHVQQAAAVLADAIQARRKLLIVADYDCDGATACAVGLRALRRSEEHTSELQSLMRNSYAVFCLKKKK